MNELHKMEELNNCKSELKAIYEKSFPANERRDFDDLMFLHENEKKMHIDLYACENAVKVILIYWTFDDFVYMEHLAVDEKFRNKGWGSGVIRDFIQSNPLPVVLEVELPCDDVSKKRIAFYERLGFVLHDQKYIQPSYGADKQSVEMRLMSRGKMNLNRVREVLYINVYKAT